MNYYTAPQFYTVLPDGTIITAATKAALFIKIKEYKENSK
jgi:peptidoglycan hydrolase-like protein with peptidoglycan-binding domain